MTVFNRHLTITGVLEDVVLAMDFVEAAARAAGLDETGIHHCVLAVDEAVTNIVEHAYGGTGIRRMIEVQCHADAHGLTLRISDDGPPFNPLNRPEPPSLNRADLKIGGLGVAFIKKIMTTTAYTHDGRYNVLTLYRQRGDVSAPGASTSPVSTFPTPISVRPLDGAPGGKGRIVAPGALDVTTIGAFDTVIAGLFEDGVTQFVIDLAAVARIDTAGVKALVGYWQRAREQKGELVLMNASPIIRDSFQIMGLDMMFVFLDPPDAAAHFTRRPR